MHLIEIGMSVVSGISGDAQCVILIIISVVVFTLLLFVIRFTFIGPDLVILVARFGDVELVDHLDRDMRRRHPPVIVDTTAIIAFQTVGLLLLVTSALL